jgi:hypothetical protein
MAIGTLYFGLVDFDFSKVDRQLLTAENLGKVLKSNKIKDYQSSIEDLALKHRNIVELFDHVQAVGFYDIESFLDPEKNKSYLLNQIIGLLTGKYKHLCRPEDYTILFSHWVELFSETRAVKKSSGKALWVAGCSFSSAVGVNSDERWGHLVAEKLGVEEVNLAMGGGSIWDANDQIIRSDIQKGDVLIWGLTSLGRIELLIDGVLRSLSPLPAVAESLTHEYFKIDYLDSDTLKFLGIRLIHQVIAHCNKIGIELYLVNFLDSTWIPKIFSERENFLDLARELDSLLDYGTDSEHPGPLQHKEYAEKIIKFIKGEKNYGRNERTTRVGW